MEWEGLIALIVAIKGLVIALGAVLFNLFKKNGNGKAVEGIQELKKEIHKVEEVLDKISHDGKSGT